MADIVVLEATALCVQVQVLSPAPSLLNSACALKLTTVDGAIEHV